MSRVTCLVAHLGQVHDRHAPGTKRTHHAVLADFIPDRDKWYCVELMVKSNTPGNADGEVKFWIDGQLKGDFPNLDMRSIASLKLNSVHIMLHAGRATRLNTKWYDNVVIAKRYIGPMAR